MEELNQSCLAIEYLYWSAIVSTCTLADLLIVQYFALALDLFVALGRCESILLDKDRCYNKCEEEILPQPK